MRDTLFGMGKPGRLTSSELTTVQAGTTLAKNTAKRWKLLQAAVKKSLGRSIAVAGPAGGYRSATVQHAMHLAGAGHDQAAKRKWGLNPNSTVAIADDPYGTHQDGTRVDVVGTAMDAKFLAIAKKYGFVLEFPGRDPNHLKDTGTYKITVATTVKAATASKKVYATVHSGQTLTSIAQDHKMSLGKLLTLNPTIKNANVIRIGQRVRVA